MSDTSSDELVFQETLDLLEWPSLCLHLSKFASTAEGERNCQNLSIPSDLETSRLRMAETLEMTSLDASLDGGLSFRGVHEIGNITSRCSKGGIATGLELLAIAETLSTARRLRRQIEESEFCPVLRELVSDLATLPDLERKLRFGLEEGGRVADRSSECLSNLRHQRLDWLKERRQRLQEILRTSGSIFHENVITERHGRPVLSLKVGAAHQLSGLVHGTSASGNTVFVEPKDVISLGNRIVEKDSQIFSEERRLLAEWSQDVGEKEFGLKHLIDVLLKLDIALARSRYGDWLGGVPAELKSDKNAPFRFCNLRHPLLLWQYRNKGGKEVVPINIHVSSTLRVVTITGPNTGGKTVTLKSIGLATLMAQAGLLVPCSEPPSLPWCDQVLADIGDEQSLQQNLSTFSGHIKRIDRILEAINGDSPRALILLDEIGAGTDPSEGAALAMALLSTLADTARLTIATTHLGELKALKYSDSRFENASVSFDSETISPTFQLQWGIPGRSNAIAIAATLGLDPQIIDKAKILLRPRIDGEVNAIICGLEEQRLRQQKAAEEAASLLARTELLHEQVLARWQKHRDELQKIQDHGRQRLDESILEGQKEVRNLIRKLKEKNADGEIARQAGQRLRALQISNQASKEKSFNKSWTPRIGDQVRLIELGKSGIVSDISDDGLQLTVQCGILRSVVHLSSLESLEGEKPNIPNLVVKVSSKLTKSGSFNSVRTSANTVDVRGLRVHEAEAVIEEFLRTSTGSVWVIHGIGTGKLKRGLCAWLETVPYVQGFKDAEKGDGGPGCTVISLN